jgi:sugar lactone lactonase YvrE
MNKRYFKLYTLWLFIVIIFSLPAVAQTTQVTAPPEMPNVIAPGAKVEKVAGDFGFIEGPVWHRDGYLLFTDIPRNRIMKWHPKDGVSVFREPSEQANGLAFDTQGRLAACEHKARRVSRTEADGKIETIVDKFEGKRLNSPNDLAFWRDGSIFFTDPPYGLPRQIEGKELDFNGVYRLTPTGELAVLVKDFERPNGIAFSPNYKTLYVADTSKRHVRTFEVKSDGSLAAGRVFAELQPWAPNIQGGPDGMKVDNKGNLYVTGPGGVWVFDEKGKRLGVIITPEIPANCGFGDEDSKTLYITARTGLYRIRLKFAGAKP